TGQEKPYEGTVSIPNRLKVAYFSQNIEEMHGRSALHEVMSADMNVERLSQKLREFEKKLEDSALNAISDDAMATLLEKYGETQAEFELAGGYTLEARAQESLSGLGIGP